MAVVLMSKPGYWDVRYRTALSSPATQLVRAESEEKARETFLEFLPTAEVLWVREASVVFDDSVGSEDNVDVLQEQMALAAIRLKLVEKGLSCR